MSAGVQVPASARPAALVALLAAAVLLLDLLPLTRHPAGEALARACLSTTCHQRPGRSFGLGGTTLASCARCTGLHAGVLAGALSVVAGGSALARRRALLLRGSALAAAILAFDVAAGVLVASWDAPVLRALTGLAAAGLVTGWGLAARPDTQRMPAPREAWA